MPVEARDDLARLTPDATTEQQPVEVARLLRIELVNAIGQERPQFLAFGIISTWNDLGSHGTSLDNHRTSRNIPAEGNGTSCGGASYDCCLP